ncbi:MAG: hypothetical protein R3202_00055 [Candidatus Competibacterales bacterium]|nr:hypothetical protein [Candidatus Competibacterales bacterium]
MLTRRLCPSLGFVILLPGLLAAQPAERPELWRELAPQLEQVLELQERHDELPRSAWFGPDQASNRVDIEALLDEAVTLLADSPGGDYRARIRELEAAIRATRDEIARARQDRIAAPEQALWARTTADYDRIIAEGEQRIARLQDRIAGVRREFAERLGDYGLQLDEAQLDFLLSTVTGDQLIDLGVAFDNVRVMVGQLEQLLVDSGENLAAARRYYGLYALLLETLVTLHRQVLATVADYRERIAGIENRTHDLIAESRRLAAQDERHRAVLAANVEAQRLTLESAAMYTDYLREQAAVVDQSRQRLEHDLAVARNTYETVRVSGDLVRLMRSGQQVLDALSLRQAPTLFTFRNLALKREFEQLTRRLQREE